MQSAEGTVCLVLCNAPDADTAANIGRALIESRLAACVNIGASVHSVYRWDGAIEEAVEVPMTIKTVLARAPAVEEAIRASHPYDVPEILVVPVSGGSAAYLDWVRAETRPA